MVAQVIWGVLAHSLGLLADAGHNLADVAALAIAVIALRYSLRRPTKARSYGHHRATILAALANGGLLLAVTAFVAVDAVIRFWHPARVNGGAVAGRRRRGGPVQRDRRGARARAPHRRSRAT